MHKPFPIPAALALALGACTAPPMHSTAIAPDAQESLRFALDARGVQVYECRVERTSGRPAWAFVAPEAELLDKHGHAAGTHGAGPVWQAPDGSRVMGTVTRRADAPDPNAIPWLLLTARSTGMPGRFSEVTSIQRLRTQGGLAPATGCDDAAIGRTARVPYAAEYRFFAMPAANAQRPEPPERYSFALQEASTRLP